MGISIRQVLSHSLRAALLALLGFLFSVLAVALFMVSIFGVPLSYGLLFGSIYGGSSSIVVISLASKIKISEKGKTTLILESATTDILCIVVSLALIGAIMTGHTDYMSIGAGIAGKFLIGAGLGIALGILGLFVLRRVSYLPFSYMLTLAIALFAYSISETVGGSGALSALVFGLILGNETAVFKVLRRKTTANLAVDEGLRRFKSEIAFFIRTFFFVFLGIIATISNVNFIFLGIALSLLLLIVRYGAVYLTTLRNKLKNERSILTFVLTRGLAAAVLATLPAEYGLSYAPLFINFAVVIIMSTAVIATVGVIVLSRKQSG
jgi:cell volume regulation protein A